MYETEDPVVRRLSTARWMRVEALQTTLRTMEEQIFNLSVGRRAAGSLMDSVTVQTPFDMATRFSETGEYVCVDLGDWPAKWSTLRLAVQTVDDNVRERIPGGEGSGKQPSQPSRGLQDAFASFHNQISSFYRQLVQGHCVYSRRTFEASFRMVWRGQLLRDFVPDMQGLANIQDLYLGAELDTRIPVAATMRLLARNLDIPVDGYTRMSLFGPIIDNRTVAFRMTLVDGMLRGHLLEYVNVT